MSVVIELSEDTEQRLRERAADAGKRPEEFARQLVEASLTVPTLEEDLAQFRKAILASGETEEESGLFFQNLVDEVRADRAQSGK